MTQAIETAVIEVLKYGLSVLENTPPGQNRIHVAESILTQAEDLLMLVIKESQTVHDEEQIPQKEQ